MKIDLYTICSRTNFRYETLLTRLGQMEGSVKELSSKIDEMSQPKESEDNAEDSLPRGDPVSSYGDNWKLRRNSKRLSFAPGPSVLKSM